jgi:hypothetical protein
VCRRMHRGCTGALAALTDRLVRIRRAAQRLLSSLGSRRFVSPSRVLHAWHSRGHVVSLFPKPRGRIFENLSPILGGRLNTRQVVEAARFAEKDVNILARG